MRLSAFDIFFRAVYITKALSLQRDAFLRLGNSLMESPAPCPLASAMLQYSTLQPLPHRVQLLAFASSSSALVISWEEFYRYKDSSQVEMMQISGFNSHKILSASLASETLTPTLSVPIISPISLPIMAEFISNAAISSASFYNIYRIRYTLIFPQPYCAIRTFLFEGNASFLKAIFSETGSCNEKLRNCHNKTIDILCSIAIMNQRQEENI